MAMGADQPPPAITLTDPGNREGAPSPAQSPSKETYHNTDLVPRIAPGRPGTPSRVGSGNGNARPDSSSGWPSPGRLIRTLSSNTATQAANGVPKEDTNAKDVAAAMDPLSQHILKRTNMTFGNSPTASAKPRAADAVDGDKDERPLTEQTSAPAVQEPLSRINAEHAHKELKKGVKAVSFLSRLIGSKKKVDADDETVDEESASGDNRPEGNDAEVFAQPVDNMGFEPRHPQPPKYIKVRSKNKKERDFDRLFLAQELFGTSSSGKTERRDTSNKLRRKNSAQPSDNTVWAMEFSRDGKYLAAAGADMVIRVWSVLSNLDERKQHERQESKENEAKGVDRHAEHLSAPVFQSKPIWEYDNHTAPILDLSWSKNNFLLSSSMDKTVRLWHISRAECLCTFKHNDFVPSISFHPKDDRFFLAGSLDSKLRLWSIPDKSVAYSVQVPDMITAVAFTPCGKWAIAGGLSGLCMFYETEGMKYQTQIHVRSTRGQNAKGSKITGIKTQLGTVNDIKVLITSNDSRVRLYNFRDKSLELKFKGNENTGSQIRASLSDDGRYVVCGSEDRKAYIWSMDHLHGERRDKTPVETFEAHDTTTTVVCFAPTKTRLQLSKSEDPIYDLCNPPPVTLLSRAERSGSSSRPPTENGSVQATPTDAEGQFDKPQESSAYLSRCAHRTGSIIVTADYAGRIKVFRQDCAWSKRPQDDWDKSSIFTRRSGKVSRTASLATRASQRSLTDKRNSTTAQAPADRINSWRHGIATYPNIRNGSPKPSGKSRSISPRKSIDRRSRQTIDTKNGSLGSDSINSATAAPLAADVMVNSPDAMEQDPMEAAVPARAQNINAGDMDKEGQDGTLVAHSDSNPLAIINGQSYAFWDIHDVKQRAEQMRRAHELSLESQASHPQPLTPIPSRSPDEPNSSRLAEQGRDEDDRNHLTVRPPLQQTDTFISELSDEQSSADEYDDAQEERWHGDDGGDQHGNAWPGPTHRNGGPGRFQRNGSMY